MAGDSSGDILVLNTGSSSIKMRAIRWIIR